jgi:hypothetical protein
MKIKLTPTLFALMGVAGMSVAAAELKVTAPPKIDLTGLWKINPEQSDDPQKVVAQKREDSTGGGPIRGGGGGGRRGSATIDVGDIFGGGTIGGGTVGGSVGRGGGSRGGSSDRPDGDPEPATTRMPLDSFLATREQFEIQQRPEALTISTVDETSTCKPAETAKTPMPNGEMVDQHCGWDGATWVMELKSEDGVTRLNRYELRKNGGQLVMVSQIKGGHGTLKGLQIKRVYDRVVAF